MENKYNLPITISTPKKFKYIGTGIYKFINDYKSQYHHTFIYYRILNHKHYGIKIKIL